jgi:hypothetical protein
VRDVACWRLETQLLAVSVHYGFNDGPSQRNFCRDPGKGGYSDELNLRTRRCGSRDIV